MCYRPIHIYNPVRTFNFDQPVKIAVPCGNCADCQRIKQNEWFFRSFMEYKYYRKIGGACYFITLTYDDEHLPHFIAPDGTQQACFNKTHIHNFIKYLRIWLSRHGYMSNGIKYFICSEYGKNTKRPHYHGLLFFPYHVPNFHHLMEKVWKHGFIICSKQGWEILSVSGIRYVSKYIAKDFTFYNLPSMKFLTDPNDFKAFKRENSQYFPSHWQSVGYGEQFIDVIAKQPDIPKYLSNNSVNLWNGSDGTFPIPRYYHLKLEKSINKEYSKLLDKVVLERTPIGTDVRRIRLGQSVIKDMSNLSYINKSHIANSLPHSLILESQYNFLKDNNVQSFFRLENIFHKDIIDFENYSNIRLSLCNNLPFALENVDRYRLSLYRFFLRYQPIFPDEVPEHKFLEISDIVHSILYPSVYPPEFKDIIVPDGLSEFGKPLNECNYKRDIQLCKDNPYFVQYESVCKLLDLFNNLSSLSKEFNYLYKEYRRKLCKYQQGSTPKVYKSKN